MKLSIYHKTIEDISVFDEIMSLYAQEADDVQILSENRRSYRGLEQLLLEIDTATTVVAVSDLSSLGLTTEDILNGSFLTMYVYSFASTLRLMNMA